MWYHYEVESPAGNSRVHIYLTTKPLITSLSIHFGGFSFAPHQAACLIYVYHRLSLYITPSEGDHPVLCGGRSICHPSGREILLLLRRLDIGAPPPPATWHDKFHAPTRWYYRRPHTMAKIKQPKPIEKFIADMDMDPMKWYDSQSRRLLSIISATFWVFRFPLLVGPLVLYFFWLMAN